MENNKTYYAIPTNGQFRKGIQLLTVSTDVTEPIYVEDWEVGRINGSTYLLVNKPREEYVACALQSDGSYQYFYKSLNGQILVKDETGNIIDVKENWIHPGVEAMQGRIVAVGDTIAIVRDKLLGITKSIKILELRKKEDANEIIERLEQAEKYFRTLKKSLQPRFDYSAQQGFKWRFGAKRTSETTPTAHSTKAPDLHSEPDQTLAEGTTRQFGPSDTRRLATIRPGVRRWVDADEYAKIQQAKMPKTEPTEERKFRVGEKVPHKGEEVEVKDVGDNVVAYKREDGSKGWFRKREYEPGAEQEKRNKVLSEQERKREVEDYLTEGAHELKAKEQRERLQYKPEATGQTYLDEVRDIQKEATETEAYKDFAKEMEEKGWEKYGEFGFEKKIKYGLEGVTISGTLNRIWIPEEEDYVATYNGQSLMTLHKGKKYKITDVVDGEKLTLRNPDTKEDVDVDIHELDIYRGAIKIDEDGNAFVEKAGKEIGELELAEGVTQQDLLKPGVIKIVKDEVWKYTKEAEGTLFADTLLGRIDQGVAFYKHGGEMGVVDGKRRTHRVKKDNHRRPIDRDRLTNDEKKVRRDVKKKRDELDTEERRREDINIAKARMELAQGKISGAEKKLTKSEYKDVFENYVGNAIKGSSEKEFDTLLVDSYLKEDWKANIDSLAEAMKAKDAHRAREIEEFNKMSDGGVIKVIPADRPVGDYRTLAEDFLRERRDNYFRTVRREEAAKRWRGKDSGKFDWVDMAEIPGNAKAVQDNAMKIRDSAENEYIVSYAVVPMDSVVQSHTMEGEQVTDHPIELQARERAEAGSVEQMKYIARNIDDRAVVESADATRGAPVAYSRDGKTYIIQGNGRAAGIKGTEGEARNTYHRLVLDRAKELGMDASRISDNDMLVRVLTPRHTYEDARFLAAFGQESSAREYTETEAARARQNAVRTPLDFQNIDLEGIGNKPIDTSNITTFVSNNPELYKRITETAGYPKHTIEGQVDRQARIVNIAMLSQLRPDFVRSAAQGDKKINSLVKRLAPTLVMNQKAVGDGKVPEYADIQNFMHKVMTTYDRLDSATKNLMSIGKAGQVEFLNDDPSNPNSKTLVHQMRQEDLMSEGSGEEKNLMRDPLHIIGLVAFHETMRPRGEENIEAQAAKFSLKMRRFSDALKTLGEAGDDMFAEQKTEEEKKAEQLDRVILIAEKTLLENKPYKPGEEDLTTDEQAAAKDQYAGFDVHKRMRKIAEHYNFSLAGQKMKKSIFSSVMGYFLPDINDEEREEIREFAKSLQIGKVDTDPSEAQIEAGNYRKGHIKLHGLDITIENPKGSIRKGKDRSGKKWESKMKHHYGYIRRSEGADGDHVDVFVGDNPDSEKVFIIDQVDPKTGRFDEHKTIFATETAGEAKRTYLANYEKNWKGLGGITEVTVDEFKKLLKDGDLKKRISKSKWYDIIFKSQLKLFGDEPQEGQTKEFAPGDTRKLVKMPSGVKRWVDADEASKIEKMKFEAQRAKKKEGKFKEDPKFTLQHDKGGKRHWRPKGEGKETLFEQKDEGEYEKAKSLIATAFKAEKAKYGYPKAKGLENYLDDIINSKDPKRIMELSKEFDQYLKIGLAQRYIDDTPELEPAIEATRKLIMDKRKSIIKPITETKNLDIAINHFKGGANDSEFYKYAHDELVDFKSYLRNPELFGLYEETQFPTPKQELKHVLSMIEKKYKKWLAGLSIKGTKTYDILQAIKNDDLNIRTLSRKELEQPTDSQAQHAQDKEEIKQYAEQTGIAKESEKQEIEKKATKQEKQKMDKIDSIAINTKSDLQKLMTMLEKIAEKRNIYAIGLRGIYKEEVGKRKLRPSYSWTDDSGEVTRDSIPGESTPYRQMAGTSAVYVGDVDDRVDDLMISISSAYKDAKNYGDGTIAIVLGQSRADEEVGDPGEVVLSDAHVVAYIDKLDLDELIREKKHTEDVEAEERKKEKERPTKPDEVLISTAIEGKDDKTVYMVFDKHSNKLVGKYDSKDDAERERGIYLKTAGDKQ